MTIKVKLTGGLGNQMFQFATGYTVAKKNNVDLSLDLGWFRRRKLHNGFELQKVFDIYSKVSFLNKALSFKSISWREIVNKFDKNFYIFKEPHFHYSSKILELPKHSFLRGYWQSELYFNCNALEIKKIFSFTKKLDKRNSLIANEIIDTNSISIHIRRGDFLLKQNENHNISLKEYYLETIKKTSKYFVNPKYFIFTDDAIWVAENFKLDYSYTIVDINRGPNSFLDMHLMSLCKSNIIANSSFSWWGAWLNNNKDKVVYAPKNWFKDKSICTDNLIPNSWNLL